jgi:PAS domain S-box-containing protein
MVLMFVVVSVVGVVYERARSTRDAAEAATRDAEFGADAAARQISLDLRSVTAMVSGLAAKAPISRSFDPGPPACALEYSGAPAFTTGHLDVIAADGTVACSSLDAAPPIGYGDAAWISDALVRSSTSGPVEDLRTGKEVVVVSAPVPGLGLVAAFLDLDSLGPGLLSTFGGPRGLEFLVVTGDGQLALSRSIDPQRWTGTPLTGTPIADSAQRSPRRDVEGTLRFYASAPVEATGWRVYAGADRAQALATSNALNRNSLLLASLLLAVVIATGLVLARRIALPILALSEQVRRPLTDPSTEPAPIRGPREIAELAGHLNRLTESLRNESEATARGAAIVESSADSIISWTPSGITATWNARSEQMYGYKAEEAIGRDMSLIVPPEHIAELRRLHRQVLLGETVEPIETHKVRRDGTLIDVSVTLSPVRDRTGAVVGVSAVGRDITDAKRAVEALRSSEARKGAILASALDAIITMNHEGRIEEFNPAAERTFGYAAAEAVGRLLSDVVLPPARRDGHDRGLERFLATGEARLVGRCTELTAVRADGTLFPAEITINGVDMCGPPVFTGFIRDLTDRKAAEAERRSLEDRLHQAQRLESLGQLAGGVAHDFNNLLAVILNYATFVAEAVPDDDDVQFDVAQILSASDRAAGLTRQLLMFARREPVRPETLDLNAVVEDVRGLLSSSIGEQIDLVVNAGTDLPAIRADRGQTEQILLNLAVNARDAMPDGGLLTIDTAPFDLDVDHVQFHPGTAPGRYVQLSVSDNGTGMSREVAARAFEPFFSTKARTDGSGLGLATVYGIVTEAGGAVSLYSEEGLGTTVRVYLPATGAHPAAATAGPSPVPERGHGETILVVEDQDAVLAVTVRILRRNGYVALEAASAADAISIAATRAVDLLLTDVVMPTMTGDVLAGVLRVDRPALAVLYMSGYAQNVFGAQRSFDDGVGLIQKPFGEVTLLRGVHDALTAGRQEAIGSAVVPADQR